MPVKKNIDRKEVSFKHKWRDMKLENVARRPGSLDVLKYPSRMGNSLFYTDGRIEKDKK